MQRFFSLLTMLVVAVGFNIYPMSKKEQDEVYAEKLADEARRSAKPHSDFDNLQDIFSCSYSSAMNFPHLTHSAAAESATPLTSVPAVSSIAGGQSAQSQLKSDFALGLSRQELEEAINQIPGARSKTITLDLANEVLRDSDELINNIVTNIQKGIFRKGEKDVLLFGVPGLGKSTIPLAIARVCDIPCLFFSAGTISTKWQNEGIMNLNAIFTIAKTYNKPCIVFLDELETLAEKHHSKENNEKGILRALWSEIDAVSDTKIVVIATMNSRKYLPEQVRGRTAQVEIQLPTKEQRETSFKFHLEQQAELYGVKYASDVTAQTLANKTGDFSYRDIEDVVIKATGRGLRSDKDKLVTMQDFAKAITAIMNDTKRIEERAKGTWSYETKKHLKKNWIAIAGLTVAIAGLVGGYCYFKGGQATAAAAASQAQAQHKEQMAQTKESATLHKNGLMAATLGTIGMAVAGPGGAAAGAAVGTVAGDYIWDGTRWVIKESCDYASKSCSIQ